MHVVDGCLFASGLALAQPFSVLPGFINDTVQLAPHLAPYKNTLVGLLTLIISACFMMPQQLWAARLAEGRDRVKGLLLVFGMLERLPWLFIGLVAAFVAERSPELAIFLFLAFVFLWRFDTGLVFPVWREMVAKTTPVRRRGLLFALAEFTGGAAGLGALFVAARFIRGREYPVNYTILFFGMFALIMISFLPLVLLREAPYPVERETVSLREHLGRVWAALRRDGALQRYFLCRGLFGLMKVAEQSFFAMRAVEVLGKAAAAELVVMLAVVITATRAVSSLFLGPLGDRLGYRAVLSLSCAFGAAAITAALLADSLAGFYLSYVLATFSHVSFFLGNSNYMLELAPAGKRPSYVSMSNMFGLPFVAAPFVGGWLADSLGYGVPFVIGAGLGLAGALCFLTVAPEPRHSMGDDVVT